MQNPVQNDRSVRNMRLVQPRTGWLALLGVGVLLGLSILDSIDSDAAGSDASTNPRAPVTLPSGKPTLSPKYRPFPVPSRKTFQWPTVKPTLPLKPRDVNGFQLSVQGESLAISYYTQDATLVLDPKFPPSVVLRPIPPTSVTPSVIQASQWPKGSSSASVKLGKLAAGTRPRVRGNISFRFCKTDTKECKQATRKLSLD